MANARMAQQEWDDYTKVMGNYVSDYRDYERRVDAVKAGTSQPMVRGNDGSYYKATGVDADGNFTVDQSKFQNVDVGPKPYQGTVSEDGKTMTTSPVYGGEDGAETITPGATYEILAAPADPGISEPNFTRAEATAVQNPPPSLAKQSMSSSPSVIQRVKEEKGANWSAYRGGLDSSAGILAKVLKGSI